MFDGKFRAPVDKAVKPLGDGLRRTGLTPDHLTFVGLLISVGSAVAIGAGYLRLGLLLVVLAALPDLRPEPLILLGGPGWWPVGPPRGERVSDLSEAITMLARAAGA